MKLELAISALALLIGLGAASVAQANSIDDLFPGVEEYHSTNAPLALDLTLPFEPNEPGRNAEANAAPGPRAPQLKSFGKSRGPIETADVRDEEKKAVSRGPIETADVFELSDEDGWTDAPMSGWDAFEVPVDSRGVVRGAHRPDFSLGASGAPKFDPLDF